MRTSGTLIPCSPRDSLNSKITPKHLSSGTDFTLSTLSGFTIDNSSFYQVTQNVIGFYIQVTGSYPANTSKQTGTIFVE